MRLVVLRTSISQCTEATYARVLLPVQRHRCIWALGTERRNLQVAHPFCLNADEGDCIE